MSVAKAHAVLPSYCASKSLSRMRRMAAADIEERRGMSTTRRGAIAHAGLEICGAKKSVSVFLAAAAIASNIVAWN